MCGRYMLTAPPSDLSDLLPHAPTPILWPNVPPRWNIAPTQGVLTVRRDGDSGFSAGLLRWGLVPHWSRDRGGPPLINARAETLEAKASFREALRRRRCLVPATGFYEWRSEGGTKHPHLIQRAQQHARGSDAFWFAGLWDQWQGPDGPVVSVAIITVAASPDLAWLHHRMPVILPDAATATDWLDRARFVPTPSGTLTTRPVGPRVNAVQHDDPACAEPPTQGSLF